jgi:hypothetical protein
MNWINIHTDVLRSESYLGAEPVERATWLNLLGWCCSQENGGSIKGAATWSDRKWQQLCGITKEEATLVSDLYHIDDAGNMLVSLYPIDKEQEVASKREIARANGKKGGRPKLKTDKKPTLVNPENPEQTNVIKRKGREGKEREGKEREREHGITPADSEPENVIISGEMPPVTLEAAKSKGEEMMVMPEVVEAWWLARDAVGWLRKEQPVRRWISDLKAYHAAWQRSGNTLPAAHNQPAKKQANRLATKDIPRIA